jgi:hypothetical protein
MKEPKNIRIILVPVGQIERRDLENIEKSNFKSKAQIVNYLFNTRSSYMKEESFELKPLILTPDEFRKELAFQPKAHKSFSAAMLNVRKRKQCYDLSEFMDEFNNEDFGGETNKYWMGYVKLK